MLVLQFWHTGCCVVDDAYVSLGASVASLETKAIALSEVGIDYRELHDKRCDATLLADSK